MIRFIAGNPGAGKGLYAMRLIVEELTKGSRPVVTNLAIDRGGLNEYLQREFPEKSVDLFQRLHILADEEVSKFYLHRKGFGTVEVDGKDRLTFLDCTGIFWVLDEVQNFFNARRWAETGAHALFYLSQHRKLGDDVWLCTQHPNNVDKQFRSVAQDYVYLRNLSNERRGIFRLPNQFIWSQYLEPKTGQNITATASGTFRLDVSGLGSCYYTAAGVGVPGTGEADTKKRQTGIAWQWAFVALGLVVALFWMFGNGGLAWIMGKVLPTGKTTAQVVRPASPAPVANPSPVVPAPAVQATAPAVQPPPPPQPPPRRITGYAKHGGVFKVYYADGGDETVVEGDIFTGANGVIVRGRRHEFHRPEPQESKPTASIQ